MVVSADRGKAEAGPLKPLCKGLSRAWVAQIVMTLATIVRPLVVAGYVVLLIVYSVLAGLACGAF
jgi:hypothetical protein